MTNGQKILIYIKCPYGSFAERTLLPFISIKLHASERQKQRPLPCTLFTANRPNIAVLN